MPNSFKPQQNSSTTDVNKLAGVRVVFSFAPCFIFLYINCVMLYTLRSKTVFRETSRYLLLYSLLLAETLQMALAQLMFLLASGSVFMTRLMCLLMLTLTIITTVISPFNLALMSLERYVAVCFPLRYANIVNATSTYGAIAVVWAVSFANMLVRVLMLMVLDPRPLGQFIGMICSKEAIFQLKIFSEFESGFVCAEFVSVGMIIICSYVGVIITAKSASTDKASANKARKTVLLHMIQLCLSLCSTLVNTILTGLSGIVDRRTIIDIRFALFVCFINLPRCLSCLIYGLRDQTIRPILMGHLRLGLNLPHLKVSYLRHE
ncbi:unnamed protein product [Merluccius merluccius]